MWLINCDTMKLDCIVSEDEIPEYVILSHTWGNDEITFTDMMDDPNVKTKVEFTKIRHCCKQAKRDRLKYVWVNMYVSPSSC
jgi:hypothetical protein